MNEAVLSAVSYTKAADAGALLSRARIRSRIRRAKDPSGRGCGFSLFVAAADAEKARRILGLKEGGG